MSTLYRQLIVPRVGILILRDMPTAYNDGRGFCPPMREHDPTLTAQAATGYGQIDSLPW